MSPDRSASVSCDDRVEHFCLTGVLKRDFPGGSIGGPRDTNQEKHLMWALTSGYRESSWGPEVKGRETLERKKILSSTGPFSPLRKALSVLCAPTGWPAPLHKELYCLPLCGHKGCLSYSMVSQLCMRSVRWISRVPNQKKAGRMEDREKLPSKGEK